MKKIKNIKQLKKEKRMLQQQEKELMRQISSGWHDLKENFHPRKNFEGFSSCKENRDRRNMNDDNFFKSLLSLGTTLLARKLTKSAEERIGKFFE